MKLVSSQDMRAIEAAADAGGLSYAEMMFRAGQVVASAAEEQLDGAPAIVVVLVGPGNNGGDGLVAALALADAGHILRTLVWARQPEDGLLAEAAANGAIEVLFSGAEQALETLASWLTEADLVIDALLGIGARGPIDGELAEILDCVAEAVDGEPDGPTVLAVDVPTGLDADTGAVDPHTLRADLTVTFGFPKVGHFSWPGADLVGELQIDPIGIPPELGHLVSSELSVATREDMMDRLPILEPDDHKGLRGSALIVAGSPGMVGAAILAAEAAYRAGCGLVRLALPERLHAAAVSWLPEAICLPLPDYHAEPQDPAAAQAAAEQILLAARESDAILIGPGLGRGPGAVALLGHLLFALRRPPARAKGNAAPALSPPPLVLDADALNFLADRPDLLASLPEQTVLTPHPGEMGRLTGQPAASVQKGRVAQARELARAHELVVVLKGALTVTATRLGASINPVVEPALATAGTGDVLAGAIAGLLAQGLQPEDAAALGVWLHGRAGELASDDLGPRSVMARDVLDALPDALQELEEDDELEDDLLDLIEPEDEKSWS